MAEHRRLVLAFSIYFLTLLVSICAKEYVPVLIWESSSTGTKGNSPSALTKWSSDDFSDVISKKIHSYKEKPLVVVFSEENLSVEDFSWHDVEEQGSFPLLESLTKKSSSVNFLPSVHAPIQALGDLANQGYTLKTIELGKESEVFSTSNDESVLIIKMDDAKAEEDRPAFLSRHDQVISRIYNDLLKNHPNLLAIYTGRYSSFFDLDTEPLHRLRRQAVGNVTNERLWSASNPGGTSSIFMYFFDNFPLLNDTSPTANISLELKSISDVPSFDARDTYQRLIVKFAADKNKITLRFRFVLSPQGYWTLPSIEYEYLKSGGDVQSLTLTTSSDIEAPRGFSYHCGQTMVFRNGTASLILKNIQAQPFLNAAKFSDSYDCVWFFTIPIWTGIFITVILAGILIWGILMIMDIKTMDRFDDPKGKTITISSTE